MDLSKNIKLAKELKEYLANNSKITLNIDDFYTGIDGSKTIIELRQTPSKIYMSWYLYEFTLEELIRWIEQESPKNNKNINILNEFLWWRVWYPRNEKIKKLI